MSGNGLGTAAFHCYPELKVIIGCIPFSVGGKMVVEGDKKKRCNPSSLPRKMDAYQRNLEQNRIIVQGS